MKTRSTVAFLGISAITAALVVGSSLEGCRNDTTDNFNTTTTHTTSGTAGSTTGTGGASSMLVTINQITDPTAAGHVGPSTLVELSGVVAMSGKFLVSKGSSGSCLWGVFISSPGLTTTAPNTGMLALSYGTEATAGDGGGTAYCPVFQAGMPAGDSFPDDVAPGDVLDLWGETDSYIPSTCSATDAGPGSSNVPGLQVTKVNKVNRTSKGAPIPAPAVLDNTTDLLSLAGGTDASWLDKWGNVLVSFDNVTIEKQATGLTDAYGHMLIQAGTNGVQVGDKLFYVGYLKATDACYDGPWYPNVPPIQLTSVTGFVYLDFCNWGLTPRSKCTDLNPPSGDCAAVADAGPDANPAQVCTH